MITAREKLEAVAAMIEVWRNDDSPEGVMPDSWVVRQIAAVLGYDERSAGSEEAERLRSTVLGLMNEVAALRAWVGDEPYRDESPRDGRATVSPLAGLMARIERGEDP